MGAGTYRQHVNRRDFVPRWQYEFVQRNIAVCFGYHVRGPWNRRCDAEFCECRRDGRRWNGSKYLERVKFFFNKCRWQCGRTPGTSTIATATVPVAGSGSTGTGTASGTAVVALPAPVTRVAVAATGLPAAPTLQVPLYPDQTRWYNQLGEVFMFWNLPSDVTQVETRVSHAPDLVAGQKQAQLLTGQSFGTLSDGVWYLRAQFMNNVGLGKPGVL